MAYNAKNNPFEYLNAINRGEDIISNADDPTLAEDGYDPFMINRGLSYHIDAVMSANEMNRYYELDKKMQYLYHLYTLKPRKRIAKWSKPDRRDDISAIQAVYPMNKRSAEAALSLLNQEQIQQIQDMISTGVINNEPSRRNVGRSKAS